MNSSRHWGDVGRRCSGRPISALALVVVAVCLPIAARALTGAPGARVHVRWQPSVDETTRRAVEVQFRLETLEQLDEYTWRYDLIDTSRDNIRALLAHPAIADTHEIDRPNFVPAPSASRTARRQRVAFGSGVVAAADVLGWVFAAGAALFTFLTASQRMPALRAVRGGFARAALQTATAVRWIASGAGRVRAALERVAAPGVRFLQRGVPEVNAEVAGVFRLVFGAAVLSYFALPAQRVDASWLAVAAFDPEIEGAVHTRVMEWLGARAFVVDLTTPWLMTFGAAFVAGLCTRITFTLFVTGVVFWAYVAMSVESTHPHSTLVLTLVALLPSQWGDAWSIDAWLRRRRGREPLGSGATKRYGYAVWIPILTFGVGFSAAAWAKLTVPPDWTSWVLNGTIKYHIVSDSIGAPVDWGLQLIRHPRLAILASFAAIAVEALVVTAAFSRDARYRLALGLAAAALFCGIGLFMGIVWPAWWIPLLAFLPWGGWSPRSGPATAVVPAAPLARRTLTATQVIVAAAVMAQQVIVSGLKLERAPMFSWYDMYARSYEDPADYNASIPPAYRIAIDSDAGRVELRCTPHEEFVREFQAAVEGAPESRARVWRALRGCGADLTTARRVTLEGTARTFDWERLEFAATHAVTLGPLHAHPNEAAASRP